MIGGLGAMAPERRSEIVSLGLKSIVAGTLATFMTGAIVGFLVFEIETILKDFRMRALRLSRIFQSLVLIVLIVLTGCATAPPGSGQDARSITLLATGMFTV